MNKKILSLALLGCLSTQTYAGMFNTDVEMQEFKDLNGIQPFIIGGEDANISNFPFYARLIVTDFARLYGDFCGGSILNSRYILTAAHCLDDADVSQLAIVTNNGVVAGVRLDELKKVESIKLHEGYNASTLKNDIAIIKLKEPMTNYTAVSIPNSPTEYASLNTVTAMGLGYIDDSESKPSIIQYADVTKLTDSECDTRVQAIYGGTYESLYQECTIPKKNTSDQLTGVCNGDSGGPLTFNSGGTYKQYGLTSYGASSSCSAENVPQVFTELLGYKAWIETQTGISDITDTDEINNPDLGNNGNFGNGSGDSGGSTGLFSIFALLGLGLFRRKK